MLQCHEESYLGWDRCPCTRSECRSDVRLPPSATRVDLQSRCDYMRTERAGLQEHDAGCGCRLGQSDRLHDTIQHHARRVEELQPTPELKNPPRDKLSFPFPACLSNDPGFLLWG